ncbi:MAG TPA: hypothetical protein VG266_04015 [Candidatus Dormibacteraeota bacterium]|nr:hypothetical protein [Candidatus Dormibacteraeota bacterium]
MKEALPRILTIMGSGETSPTMSSLHGELFDRMGPPPVPAVLLDTPFGFQENAAELCAKAMQYFRDNVGRAVGVASYRHADSVDALAYETMIAQLREARYVFAGPGSPSYALRQWSGSAVHDALVEKLREGGCIVFSSAAACTVGRLSLPVYEIYKVGADPYWLEGLDLLAECDINAVVIPHDNNAEGGTHDTRHCYMGERRLRILEEQLPEGTLVLGVDEHTACVLDLDADTLTVRGVGGVTLRHGGRLHRIEKGAVAPLALLRGGGAFGVAAPSADAPADSHPAVDDLASNPFMEEVDTQRARFDAALDAGSVDAALAALLAIDSHLWRWSSETFATDDMDRARSQQRTMLVRLGALAQAGARDPAEAVAPFVETLVAMRNRAREQRRFDDADALRNRLVELGVEVHDSPNGTRWSFREPPE